MEKMEKKYKKIERFALGETIFIRLKFPSYLTSHSKPQNLRKYIGDKDMLKRMDKRLKI